MLNACGALILVRKFYSLRPIQRLLIDAHFNKAKSTMMNIGGLFKLASIINLNRLATAVNHVIDRCGIFRCRLVFNPKTSDMCQIFDDENIPVKVEYLSDSQLLRLNGACPYCYQSLPEARFKS